MSVKLPPRAGKRGPVGEAHFSGGLTDCIKRNHPANVQEFTRRWHRAQMRSWAGHWRNSRADAAILGEPAEQVAKTALYFARMYRDAKEAA